ncbi:MAG: S1 RNA-binding domain-containing protein [Rickettsia endosymbiont of Ixodes persulcatus]|nr:S1 RNA-binding domain-containing protein [Rickettsia endosymbiont of Ixodes persulcatus]
MGFLWIIDGEDLLDWFGVYFEVYLVVRCILDCLGVMLAELIGDEWLLKSLCLVDFVDDWFGIFMVIDILAELEKFGCDPWFVFLIVLFVVGVEKVVDLKLGMILEGVVINVVVFGVFVDVGVYQDGLVHVSVMLDCFVFDSYEVVKFG